MLKLRYLAEDFTLAKAALALLPHDAGNLDELLGQFRISSNAVYPFSAGGKMHFLRLAPQEEKREVNLLGELEFVAYLRDNEFPAMHMVPSRNGRQLETIACGGETYFAMVSEGVSGIRMDRLDGTEAAIAVYGRTLGWLHRLSGDFHPKQVKWSHADVLQWVEGTLRKYGAPQAALEEAALVAGILDKIPRTRGRYGLIHYDFELDNVFYDAQTGICSAIDFDDGMYHFYAMDIWQALDSLCEEMGEVAYPQAETWFLCGYEKEYALEETMLHQDVFGRFAGIYQYARLLRSTHERLAHEPDWMTSLRETLTEAMEKSSRVFGTLLDYRA